MKKLRAEGKLQRDEYPEGRLDGLMERPGLLRNVLEGCCRPRKQQIKTRAGNVRESFWAEEVCTRSVGSAGDKAWHSQLVRMPP